MQLDLNTDPPCNKFRFKVCYYPFLGVFHHYIYTFVLTTFSFLRSIFSVPVFDTRGHFHSNLPINPSIPLNGQVVSTTTPFHSQFDKPVFSTDYPIIHIRTTVNSVIVCGRFVGTTSSKEKNFWWWRRSERQLQDRISGYFVRLRKMLQEYHWFMVITSKKILGFGRTISRLTIFLFYFK